MPSVTVIIPNYNNSRFLRECINSVLNQTFPPAEIVIIDDCSTDDSRDIILEYEKKCETIKHVFLQKNAGVSNARNIGIEVSTSDLITFLDADDFYYDSHKLENEYQLCKQHSFKCVSYSLTVFVDVQSFVIRRNKKRKKHLMQGKITKKLLSNYWNDVVMRDYLIPKSILSKIRYDKNLSLFEDYDFLIQLSLLCPFYCTFENGTAYRIKTFGLSQRPSDIVHASKEQIRNTYLKQRSIKAQIKVFVRFFDFLHFIKKKIGKLLKRRRRCDY